ncbi:MAG: hypothetical protein H8Z69_02305 [Nanohaloarchaea archaeon]|nr:hypothetical protein [Candidatus Nanohaloarchaea archaeon]
MSLPLDGENPHVPDAYNFVWRDLRDMEEIPDKSYFHEGIYENVPEEHREALVSVLELVENKKSLTFGEINSCLETDPDILKDAAEAASFTGAVCYYGDDGYKLCST